MIFCSNHGTTAGIHKKGIIAAVIIVFIAAAVIIAQKELVRRKIAAGIAASVLTDERDGKTYRTVRIGNNRWMAENLNYKTDYSFCYGNDNSNCDKYGRLYDWNAAMDACPAGWVLPGRDHWNDLFWAADGGNYVASKKLKSKTGWNDKGNGVDRFSFSALPGGYIWGYSTFSGIGASGSWWSSAANSSWRGNAWGWNMYSDRASMNEKLYENSHGLSVRCVEDK